MEHCGLGLVPFEGVPLPRIESLPIAIYCKLHRIILVGDGPQALILGEINKLYLDNAIASLSEDSPVPKISSKAVDPLARLGSDAFARVEETDLSY